MLTASRAPTPLGNCPATAQRPARTNRVQATSRWPALWATALLLAGCDAPSEPPPDPPPPAVESPPAASRPPLRLGQPGMIDDLTVTVDRVTDCEPRSYERGLLTEQNVKLLGVYVLLSRLAATGQAPPSVYQGAPRARLSDEQGRHFRYTLRGTCAPELRGAELLAGETLEGWITFEVPRGATGLALDYPVDLVEAPPKLDSASVAPAATAPLTFHLGR